LLALTAALLPSSAGIVGPIAALANPGPFEWPDEAFQDGDIVFRTGTDVLAGLVLAHGQGARFSHVGMLIRRADQWLVVHSVPPEPGSAGGVQTESLQRFASSQVAAQVSFFRMDGLSEQSRQRLRDYLSSQLGKPFDYRFQYSDDSAQYCTELVLKAFGHAGLQMEPSMARVQVLTMPEGAIPPDSVLHWPRLRELVPPGQNAGAP
jgi:hypothetical protein